MAKPTWICPSCLDIVPGSYNECKLCCVSLLACKNSVSGVAAPVFKRAETLFFQIIECTSQTGTPIIPEQLLTKVDSFVKSDGLARLVASKWRILALIKNLMKGAVRGDKTIEFDPGGKIDPNSVGLYTILVDALNGRLRIMKEHFPGLVFPTVKRPRLFWSCPNCAKRYHLKVKQCYICVIPETVVKNSQRGNISIVLRQAFELFFRCVKGHQESASPMEMTSLETEIGTFMEGPHLTSVVSSKWCIKDAIAHLLRSVVSGRSRYISFSSSTWMDTNSTALYVILVDRINARLAELRPTTDFEVERPVMAMFDSEHWTCPYCHKEVSHDRAFCPFCIVNKMVVISCRQSLASYMWDAVGVLFMSCVEVHSGAWMGPESTVCRLKSLRADVDVLMASEHVNSMVTAEWRCIDAVNHLLYSALSGTCKDISFYSSSWMDTDSIACYTVLVDRINRCLREQLPHSGFTVERPHLHTFDETHWNCPHCKRVMRHDCEQCPVCFINKKVFLFAAGPVLCNALGLFMLCVEVHTGAHPEQGSTEDRLDALRVEIDVFLEGGEMTALVSNMWFIKDPISQLLRSALSGESRYILVSSLGTDINSAALFFILTERINNQIDKRYANSGFRVERPVLFRFADHHWNCPHCCGSIPHHKTVCSSCNISKMVWQVCQSSNIGQLLRRTIELFMSCVEIHNLTLNGPEGSEDRLNSLRGDIDDFIDGDTMASLQSLKWCIKDAIAHLLRSVVSGRSRYISFSSSTWMDTNSTALYVILVDRINARLAELRPTTDFEVERPVMAMFDSEYWTCPSCCERLSRENSVCPICNINVKVIRLLHSSQAGPLLREVEVVFMSCVELHIGAWTGNRVDQLNALGTEIDNILDGEVLIDIENSGWRLKSAFTQLLKTALSGETRVIPFMPSATIDNNSLGICMLLTDRINMCLGKRFPNSGFWVKRPVL